MEEAFNLLVLPNENRILHATEFCSAKFNMPITFDLPPKRASIFFLFLVAAAAAAC